MSDVRDVAFITPEEDLMILDAIAQASADGKYFTVQYPTGLKYASLERSFFTNVILWDYIRKKPNVKLKKKYGWGKKSLPEPNIKPKPETGAV